MIVLDLMLPGVGGLQAFTVFAKIRPESPVRFCPDNTVRYDVGNKMNDKNFDDDVESRSGSSAQAPAFSTRRDPDLRALVCGLSLSLRHLEGMMAERGVRSTIRRCIAGP